MAYNIQVYSSKADESYTVADNCLKAKKFNVAASRSYYACLQLATFALIKNRIHFKGNHRSIHEAFRQRFLGETPKLNGTLEALLSLRQTADYSDQNISQSIALDAYERAVEFRDHLKPHLK